MAAAEQREIMNEFIKVALAGTVIETGQAPKFVRITPDRSLAVWDQLVGSDGTNQRVVKVEPSGELGVLWHGKDSDGNVDALATNASRQLEVDVVGLGLGTLFSMVLRELRLINLHMGQVSGMDDATTDDVEGHG